MNEMITFLNARLDEDEAAAVRLEQDLELMRRGGAWTSSAPPATGNSVTIVSAWTPKRIRDEITLKRAIMDAYVCTDGGSPRDRDRGRWDAMHATIRRLAAVYSDHPDYRPEWAPR